jgi:glucosamine--fructose-6-phosphate aminotransferase (isomerizing)
VPAVKHAETGLWRDVRELPAALAETLDAGDGVPEAAALLGDDGVRRVVASGNGAAYYSAFALWLASLAGTGRGPEVVAVPAGVLAAGGFRWRHGDRLLAISSSGEFRDVLAAVDAAPRPVVAITAAPGSPLARRADARALQRVRSQRAVTHTQALAGAVALALAVWARVSDDAALRRAVADAPAAAERAIAATDGWAPAAVTELAAPVAAIAFGSGPAWAAALEAALLMKEVARVPCEGAETREGATSAMFGLAPGHLAISLAGEGDPAGAEAEALCRAAGAAVARLPGIDVADPRLATVTTLPAAVALTIALAAAGGHDVDRPAWTDAYYATARSGAA